MSHPPKLSNDNTRGRLHAEGLKNVKFVHLDVTDSTTIDTAKEIIEKAEGKLDVLVNNAGMLNLTLLQKQKKLK